MRGSTSQKKGLAAAIVLAAIFLLAAAGAAFFFIDGMRVDEAIARIDNTEYDDIESEKGEQYSYKGEPLTAQITESLEDTVYHTPLGFSIVSHSDKWTGEKLVEVYEQLLKNGHGEEIGYISEISLYPKEAEYSDEMDAAGDQQQADIDTEVYTDVRALLPGGLHYNAAPVVSDISLYYMDNYENATEVAKTLAHEYGHHFTQYYFMQDDDAVKNSEYYGIRGFEDYDHEIFYYDDASYYENHMWYVYEIAAEDYVQLLGSPDTRQTMEFMDNKDAIDAGIEPPDIRLKDEYVNVFPQENIFIPLADEIPGLRDYFYSFLGLQSEYDTPLETADFNLQIEKETNYGYRHYNITWTMVSTDPDTLYTLVCYDSSGELYGVVRTVYGNKTAIARVGAVVKRRGYTISGWDDSIPDEDRIFKLYVLLPDGRMMASEPFYVDF